MLGFSQMYPTFKYLIVRIQLLLSSTQLMLPKFCPNEMCWNTDYGRPERKQCSLLGRKFNPNPKFLGMAKAYFVCHIGPIFQISLIYAFIGCPQSVVDPYQQQYLIEQPKLSITTCTGRMWDIKAFKIVTKGQIISKAIFVFLTSPKKRTKTI